MTKIELINTIREMNTTASSEFLDQFTEVDLEEYAEHLLEVDNDSLTAAGCSTSVPYN